MWYSSLPTFSRGDPEFWISQLEFFLCQSHISYDHYVEFALQFLVGDAQIWAQSRDTQISEMDWCDFVYNLIWKFDPCRYIQKRNELEDEPSFSMVDNGESTGTKRTEVSAVELINIGESCLVSANVGPYGDDTTENVNEDSRSGTIDAEAVTKAVNSMIEYSVGVCTGSAEVFVEGFSENPTAISDLGRSMVPVADKHEEDILDGEGRNARNYGDKYSECVFSPSHVSESDVLDMIVEAYLGQKEEEADDTSIIKHDEIKMNTNVQGSKSFLEDTQVSVACYCFSSVARDINPRRDKTNYSIDNFVSYVKLDKSIVRDVVYVGGLTWIPIMQQFSQYFSCDMCFDPGISSFDKIGFYKFSKIVSIKCSATMHVLSGIELFSHLFVFKWKNCSLVSNIGHSYSAITFLPEYINFNYCWKSSSADMPITNFSWEPDPSLLVFAMRTTRFLDNADKSQSARNIGHTKELYTGMVSRVAALIVWICFDPGIWLTLLYASEEVIAAGQTKVVSSIVVTNVSTMMPIEANILFRCRVSSVPLQGLKCEVTGTLICNDQELTIQMHDQEKLFVASLVHSSIPNDSLPDFTAPMSSPDCIFYISIYLWLIAWSRQSLQLPTVIMDSRVDDELHALCYLGDATKVTVFQSIVLQSANTCMKGMSVAGSHMHMVVYPHDHIFYHIMQYWFLIWYTMAENKDADATGTVGLLQEMIGWFVLRHSLIQFLLVVLCIISKRSTTYGTLISSLDKRVSSGDPNIPFDSAVTAIPVGNYNWKEQQFSPMIMIPLQVIVSVLHGSVVHHFLETVPPHAKVYSAKLSFDMHPSLMLLHGKFLTEAVSSKSMGRYQILRVLLVMNCKICSLLMLPYEIWCYDPGIGWLSIMCESIRFRVWLVLQGCSTIHWMVWLVAICKFLVYLLEYILSGGLSLSTTYASVKKMVSLLVIVHSNGGSDYLIWLHAIHSMVILKSGLLQLNRRVKCIKSDIFVATTTLISVAYHCTAGGNEALSRIYLSRVTLLAVLAISCFDPCIVYKVYEKFLRLLQHNPIETDSSPSKLIHAENGIRSSNTTHILHTADTVRSLFMPTKLYPRGITGCLCYMYSPQYDCTLWQTLVLSAELCILCYDPGVLPRSILILLTSYANQGTPVEAFSAVILSG